MNPDIAVALFVGFIAGVIVGVIAVLVAEAIQFEGDEPGQGK